MNPILTAFLEPTAIVEFAAALLTAIYLLRVTFADSFHTHSLHTARREVIVRPVARPSLSKMAHESKIAEGKLISPRAAFARLIAVGEAITIRKRSLRGQSLRGQSLRGQSLRGQSLRGQSLRGQSLRGKRFRIR